MERRVGMTASTIQERGEAIVAEFSRLEDWVARYRHLVALGEAMPGSDGSLRCEEHAIPGCEYAVWIRAEYDAVAGVLRFQADSDAKITRGIAALILRVVNGQPPSAVESAELGFLDAIGLRGHLSARRSTGLDAMVHWIRRRAREAGDHGERSGG
jgi:cysteine desulfuration protein SufE